MASRLHPRTRKLRRLPLAVRYRRGSAKMANCGVKRDQRNACIHFRKHCQVGFFEIIDRRFVGQRLQSCLSNGVGFCVRFGRATISGVGKNPGSQRMSKEMCTFLVYLVQAPLLKQIRPFVLSNSGARVGSGGVMKRTTTRCGAEKQLASLSGAHTSNPF